MGLLFEKNLCKSVKSVGLLFEKNLWDISLAIEKLLVFVFEISSKNTFSLIPLSVSPDLKSYSARRPAGFVIRRQKRFDLLKPGDL